MIEFVNGTIVRLENLGLRAQLQVSTDFVNCIEAIGDLQYNENQEVSASAAKLLSCHQVKDEDTDNKTNVY